MENSRSKNSRQESEVNSCKPVSWEKDRDELRDIVREIETQRDEQRVCFQK